MLLISLKRLAPSAEGSSGKLNLQDFGPVQIYLIFFYSKDNELTRGCGLGLKNTVKQIVPEKYHWQLYNGFKNHTSWRSRSYSSFGEDQVIHNLVTKKRNGFYVDVGAFHPHKYSNTYYFYKYFNWQGINIEPNPGNFKLFEKDRSRDLNLNLGVADKKGELRYFMFNDGLYNTFDETRKTELVSQGIPLVGEKTIPVSPLAEVFATYLQGRSIDFMNVDVEMLDLMVLNSNDWSKYRPEVIAIEDHAFQIEHHAHSPIYQLLSKQGYRIESKCHFTSIYKRF